MCTPYSSRGGSSRSSLPESWCPPRGRRSWRISRSAKNCHYAPCMHCRRSPGWGCRRAPTSPPKTWLHPPPLMGYSGWWASSLLASHSPSYLPHSPHWWRWPSLGSTGASACTLGRPSWICGSCCAVGTLPQNSALSEQLCITRFLVIEGGNYCLFCLFCFGVPD